MIKIEIKKEFEKQGISMTEYNSIHRWVSRRTNHLECSNCGKSGRTENALIKGLPYERKVENFIGLCNSCHSKYDGVNVGLKRSLKTKNKYRKAKLGLTGFKSYAGKPIVDGCGNIYSTMSDCARFNNISIASVSAMLKNINPNRLNLKLL